MRLLAYAALSLGTISAPLTVNARDAGMEPLNGAQSQPVDANAALEAMTRNVIARMEAENATQEARGTGPFPAMSETDLSFPDATLYHPADLAALGDRKLGLLIWGNGACVNDGASARAHLAEIASHGYLVIAPGKPLTAPSTLPGLPPPVPMTTTVQDLRKILDWALAENDRPGSPYFGRIDPDLVAVAGHSCGGMQAIIVGDDPRIKTVIVHNSGVTPKRYVLASNPPQVIHEQRIQGLKRPVLVVMGGKSDVLWEHGNNLYDKLPGPGAFVSSEIGHGGTFEQPHGGVVAGFAVDWLEWQLRGKQQAATTFVGQACKICGMPDWTIKTKGLTSVPVD